jgi:DNA-binding transcriptional LysR family regulator
MPDPVLLRTFVAVAQTMSFTRAGARLELSQPTVSQHVRRLEDSVGRQLFVRDTHGVRLTQDGEAMAGFARSILAAHEEAMGYFRGSALRGRLRFGVSDDLALTRVPRVLREFRHQHPQIDLELTVAQSDALHRRLNARQLDLIFVKNAPGDSRGDLVRRDRLVWVGPPQASIPTDRPLPLVTYNAPSITRQLALSALERVGRSWRITCISREVNGVLAATRAGVGVTVLAESLVPADLVAVPARHELPPIGQVDIVLLAHPRAPEVAVKALSAAIVGSAGLTL